MVHTISIHKIKNSTERIVNLPPHNLEMPAKITGGIITISIPTSVAPSYIHSAKNQIKKTAEIDGVLNQKTLSIEDGATLKIKTETYK